jgi:hypothetical protein
MKTFLFQFMNSYNSIIYIAFFKTHFEGCSVKDEEGVKLVLEGANCLDDLRM